MQGPRRAPYQIARSGRPPYQAAGLLRRLWSLVAGSGLAIVIGAVVATLTAFGLAFIVTVLTNMLKQ